MVNSNLNIAAGSSTSELKNNERVLISHPDHIVQKCIALLFMCLLGFGSYFCYDNPASLEDYFIKDMELSSFQYVLLYSWYAWPNVILCVLGGYLMDRILGIRLGTCIYAILVLIGQLIFAFGTYVNLFWMCIIGRFIFGAGAESLAVAQNSYAVLWFKGKELNMVFGFQLSFSRVGSFVNFLLMDPLYKYLSYYFTSYQCLGIALFIASATCFLSLICSLLLAYQDKRAECILSRRRNQTSETVKISDIKHFPVTFWLTTLTIVFYYGAILPFVANGKVFFETVYGLDSAAANLVNSILFVISAALSPFLGLIIDKFGKNITFVFVSILITIAGYSILAFIRINPLITMCIIGVSYSMVASALWPLLALVTPEHLLGTAYGIAQSFENLGLGVITALAGIIVDKYGYAMLVSFFIACLFLTLLSIVLTWIYDSKHIGYLNMTSSERTEYNRKNVKDDESDKLLPANSDSSSEEHIDDDSSGYHDTSTSRSDSIHSSKSTNSSATIIDTNVRH